MDLEMQKMNSRLEILDWDDVTRLVEELATKIVNDNYVPDVLIAVGRGGDIPARIISDLLGVKEIKHVRAKYYESISVKKDEVEVEIIDMDLKNKKVLVIDDLVDSGNTLRTIEKKILELSPSSIKVATLQVKPWSSREPDYFAMKTGNWVVYPWEKLETLLDLMKKTPGIDITKIIEKHGLAKIIKSDEIPILRQLIKKRGQNCNSQ